MKKILYYLIMLSVIAAFSVSCGSSRDVSERRTLMMPKKSELPKNSKKYKERERKYPKRKTQKSTRR
jgi:hypothetical protein